MRRVSSDSHPNPRTPRLFPPCPRPTWFFTDRPSLNVWRDINESAYRLEENSPTPLPLPWKLAQRRALGRLGQDLRQVRLPKRLLHHPHRIVQPLVQRTQSHPVRLKPQRTSPDP